MAAKRLLLGLVLTGLCGPTAFAQTEPPPPAPGGSFVPPPPDGGALFVNPPPLNAQPAATAVLTAPPTLPRNAVPLAPGSVASPWCGAVPAGAGCCGPVGRHGPISYELYTRVGGDLVIGGSPAFSGALKGGVVVGGGGRSLFMNQAGDAAWVLDLGLSYTYTVGDQSRVMDIYAPQPKNPQTGRLLGPDQLQPFRVNALYRTTFNYAVGRDWWLNGPGFVGAETSWNSRVGLDVGGMWGTSHVNLIPAGDPTNSLRKHGVTQGVFVGAHWNAEVPMGAWILFGGFRAQWGYMWTNLIPPQDGNLQDLYLLGTVGVRF
jgi:hypothetical protein